MSDGNGKTPKPGTDDAGKDKDAKQPDGNGDNPDS